MNTQSFSVCLRTKCLGIRIPLLSLIFLFLWLTLNKLMSVGYTAMKSVDFYWNAYFLAIEICYTAFSALKKNFMAPFYYGWGSTVSRLQPLRGGSLLFTTKFPEIPVTYFIDLGRMKGWVDLGATQWFWSRDPWIGNPAP